MATFQIKTGGVRTNDALCARVRDAREAGKQYVEVRVDEFDPWSSVVDWRDADGSWHCAPVLSDADGGRSIILVSEIDP